MRLPRDVFKVSVSRYGYTLEALALIAQLLSLVSSRAFFPKWVCSNKSAQPAHTSGALGEAQLEQLL